MKQLWVMFHGFTDRRDFPDICQIHEKASALYAEAPVGWVKKGGWRPHFGSWSGRLSRYVVRLMHEVVEDCNPERIVFAGNSDGATWVHTYADACIRAGVQVHCVVHYGGFWKGVVADCPGVFLHGEADPFGKIRRETSDAAKAYGMVARIVPGEHRWNPEQNENIIKWVRSQLVFNWP